MKLYIVLPVLALMFAVGGCQNKQITNEVTDFGGDQPTTEQSEDQMMASETAEDNTAQEAPQQAVLSAKVNAVKALPPAKPIEFSVTIEAGKFSPPTINVKQGDIVLLHLTSVGANMGIGIDGYGINKFVPEGKNIDVQFVADAPGTFEYFCNANCDPETKQNGLLVVAAK